MILFDNFCIASKIILIVFLPGIKAYSSFNSEILKPENDAVIKEANNQFECGISGGNKVQLNSDGIEITSYPWFVLLEYPVTNSFRQVNCAGVIINDLYVLTSSYCAKQGPISVRFGKLLPNCNTQNDSKLLTCVNPSENAFIEEIRNHPSSFQFNVQNRWDSIALLRLTKRLQFNEFVKPICLNTIENGFDDSGFFFYPQWNLKISELSSESFIKRSAVQDIDACNESHGLKLTTHKDKVICINPGSILSGGPLVHVNFGENDTRKIYVVGVKSLLTMQCNHQGQSERLSDIYTKVSSYTNWIQETMRD